jgi:hypothetical protein
MDAEARKALGIIRRCVASGRYVLLPHFRERMDQRAMFWPDVLAVLDDPADVRDGGPEDLGRPKWIVSGVAPDGLTLEMVCVLHRDGRGNVTLFITAY